MHLAVQLANEPFANKAQQWFYLLSLAAQIRYKLGGNKLGGHLPFPNHAIPNSTIYFSTVSANCQRWANNMCCLGMVLVADTLRKLESWISRNLHLVSYIVSHAAFHIFIVFWLKIGTECADYPEVSTSNIRRFSFVSLLTRLRKWNYVIKNN